MRRKILIVDDSATVRQQVRLALGPAGFEVVEAVDGQDGLAYIRTTSDIALVICDINMPRLNGIDMLSAIRTEGLRPELPIIVLTTEGQPALVRRAKDAGAKGWIVKPFNAGLLVAAVQKLTA